jgi:RND family efflux transporter MFP subunit
VALFTVRRAFPAASSYGGQERVIAGQIEAHRVATVCAEVADRVSARLVGRGDAVAAGQPLALLNDDLARAALAQAEAEATRASAAREQAESEYRRASRETAAAQRAARAGLAGAQAARAKARSFTRTHELRQAEAALAAAAADAALARKDHGRYETLVAEGAVARQVLDRARASLEAAEARRRAAEEAVSLAREGARHEDIAAAEAQVAGAEAGVFAADTRPLRLEALRRQIKGLAAQQVQAEAVTRQARIAVARRRVLAPFGGRVLDTMTETGEMAAPGTPIARVGDIGQVKAVFAVPEGARRYLRPGQTVGFTVDALPGRRFAGTIRTLSAEADPRSRAFRVEVESDNPGETMLPHMVARLSLPSPAPVHPARAGAGGANAVTVPVTAIATHTGTYGGATYCVYVLRGDRAERRAVTLGQPAAEGTVEVTSGLAAGERIASSAHRLDDGVPVRLTAGVDDAGTPSRR